mmetsp:Transcript_11928/g.34944  ORF Transcript_11928/g.34944 Transcript_11928/m.34944 type:complete len:324 (-) Transcript_11928:100-1071(-)
MMYDALHKNIIHLEWDLAESALATDAGREMAKDALKGDYPLHMACERRAPPSSITALLDAHPGAAAVPGRTASLPLHIAAERNCPPSVIVTLVRSYPEALDREDGSGRLPLDFPQRNDICREALNRPSACWIEDVEKEDYLRRVARKRTLLRQKMVQLRCAVAISAERRDRTRRAIEELEPALEAHEAYGRRHAAEEGRLRDVEERVRGRMRDLSSRIDALGSALGKSSAEADDGGSGGRGGRSASAATKCSYMTESQMECEKLVGKMAKIKGDVRGLRDVVSSLDQINSAPSIVGTKVGKAPISVVTKESSLAEDHIWKIDI